MFGKKKVRDDAEDMFGQVGFSDSPFTASEANDKNTRTSKNKKKKSSDGGSKGKLFKRKGKSKNKKNDEQSSSKSSTLDEKSEDEWWNNGAIKEKHVEWNIFDKIVIAVELLFLVYFILWLVGAVSIF
ncbi:MAG: hypothetical protein GWP09_00340 [Nitrospiraceae bacterium]|nr:hypothetical protein [Nitrospiraceae bacterium]